MKISGSCLCGQVRFSLSRPPEIMNLCHCSMCRKVSGSTYGTFAHASLGDFIWENGVELISRFNSSEGEFRAFCRTCGSCLPVEDKAGGTVCIPAGTFDDDPGVRPAVEIFLGSRAPWCEASGVIPGFEEFAPEGFGE